LELHNVAVKALRYPNTTNTRNLSGKTEKEREHELTEIAGEMFDDDEDF
jgi:hypothetical protein